MREAFAFSALREPNEVLPNGAPQTSGCTETQAGCTFRTAASRSDWNWIRASWSFRDRPKRKDKRMPGHSFLYLG